MIQFHMFPPLFQFLFKHEETHQTSAIKFLMKVYCFLFNINHSFTLIYLLFFFSQLNGIKMVDEPMEEGEPYSYNVSTFMMVHNAKDGNHYQIVLNCSCIFFEKCAWCTSNQASKNKIKGLDINPCSFNIQVTILLKIHGKVCLQICEVSVSITVPMQGVGGRPLALSSRDHSLLLPAVRLVANYISC